MPPRRTVRDLAAENAVLLSTLERIRDELDDFLSDADDGLQEEDATDDEEDDE